MRGAEPKVNLVLVAFCPAEPRIGKTKRPPKPRNPRKVPVIVKYRLQTGNQDSTVVGDQGIVYTYKYGKDVGGMPYQVGKRALPAGLAG